VASASTSTRCPKAAEIVDHTFDLKAQMLEVV
jgi:hypothetical protein